MPRTSNPRPLCIGFKTPSASHFTKCTISTWADHGQPCIFNNSFFSEGYELSRVHKTCFHVFQTNFKVKAHYKNALNIGDGSRLVTVCLCALACH